jgi:phenylalanyl-tRNA synthetase beta chain
VEHLLRHLHLPEAEFQTMTEHPICLPCAEMYISGEPFGWMGLVKTDIAEQCHVRRDLFLAEIDLDLLKKHCAGAVPAFKSLPVFPPVRRDMTLISATDLSCAAITETIRKESIDLLQDVVLVDRFLPDVQTGETQEVRHTLRLTYRHPERSLTNEEVDRVHHSLCSRLTELLPIRFS